MKKNIVWILGIFALAGCRYEYDLLGPAAEPTPGHETGSPTDSAPVARCSVTPSQVAPPFEAATWQGGESADPAGGEIVAYTWRLVESPSGSAATMPDGTGPDRAGFFADLAGTYVAELVVENAAGSSSAPCRAELEAMPAQDLWVELYWTQPNDDIDLHLLAPDGTLGTDRDCYFANCKSALPWGGSGHEDDPELDLDDIEGTGPENINIAAPEEGTFTVVVHDYPASVYDGANDVTVNVYVGGALAWSDTRSISGEDQHEYFAAIAWPSGEITALP